MTANSVLRIDGSYGEGGGQILRTALALSAVLGRPVELIKIRAGRKRTGLQPQHLSCVKALAETTGAEVHGAEIGSSRLHFVPGPITGGARRLDIGTAGAVSLVFHAILTPLAFTDQPSALVLTGGTHVPWSPPAPYISEVFLPMVERMGLTATWQVRRGGFYPKGGGEVRAVVQPLTRLSSIDLTHRGALLAIRGISAVAGLSRGIAERQADRVRCRLADAGHKIDIEIAELNAACPGDSVFLWAEFEQARAGFGALGERGKPAERVADEAADALLDFLAGDAATESHLADQLAVLMALANGRSVLTTARVSQHLLTNLWTIQQFLPIGVSLEDRLGEPGRLSIDGVGLKTSSWGAMTAARV
ncbi:MAG: RNA 3'-phosphate cyclase [candidate division NC10 bacterium]|nr:RNA 3'-phosphate cyclase [candidate division NC10 bacterium]